MSFLRRPLVVWLIAAAVLVGGGAIVGVLRADWSRGERRLAAVKEDLATVKGRIEEMERQSSRLDQDAEQLARGVARCVTKIEQRVLENNRLAEDLKATTFTSLSQLDPFVDRSEDLRDSTRRDLKTCRRAIG